MSIRNAGAILALFVLGAMPTLGATVGRDAPIVVDSNGNAMGRYVVNSIIDGSALFVALYSTKYGLTEVSLQGDQDTTLFQLHPASYIEFSNADCSGVASFLAPRLGLLPAAVQITATGTFLWIADNAAVNRQLFSYASKWQNGQCVVGSGQDNNLFQGSRRVNISRFLPPFSLK